MKEIKLVLLGLITICIICITNVVMESYDPKLQAIRLIEVLTVDDK